MVHVCVGSATARSKLGFAARKMEAVTHFLLLLLWEAAWPIGVLDPLSVSSVQLYVWQVLSTLYQPVVNGFSKE